MHERTLMPIVDDFGIHSAADRGALYAAERGLITGVDVMVNQPAAMYAVSEIRQFPNVSLGLHINFSPGVAQRKNGAETLRFRSAPDRDGLDQLATQTKVQIKKFQDMTGTNPPHVSTHNHSHMDTQGQVFPQFI